MSGAVCPWWAPPLLAVQFLTRIPVSATDRLSAAVVQVGLRRSIGWFPLVGALVGSVTAAVAIATFQLWPAFVAVPLALIVEARLTGAFHEDAVADFCDAFGGGQSPDDVRRILKDSRIGSYGALGLILAVGTRAALMATVLMQLPPAVAALAIIASACFGRLVAVAVMLLIAPAPAGTGLAKDIAGEVTLRRAGFAILTAAPALLPFALGEPLRMAAAVLGATAFVFWFRAVLRRRIGGSTGDCLGFAAYAGQLLMLLAATALR